MRKLLLAFSALYSFPILAADKIVIISPHRKSIQEEFVPRFKQFYKTKYGAEVEVDWIDQGGTNDDIRFLKSKFASNPKTSGVDIFWGGGASTFIDLSKDNFLAEYKLQPELKKQLPEKIAGVAMYDKTNSWYGSAASTFGLFLNKKLLKLTKNEAPKTWADLANSRLADQVSTTDPRHSGTAATMNAIILQGYGWEKGWDILGGIAANARKFTHSSSDPIKAVVSGDAAVAATIDFYAAAKISDLGKDNLGFIIPSDFIVIDPDPVALLKGAPHRLPAERFIQWVLGVEAQKILSLSKGEPGGPTRETLGRMAINKEAYAVVGDKAVSTNPFIFQTSFSLNTEKASKMKNFLNDLVGAIHVDTHKELKSAFTLLRKKGNRAEELKNLTIPPLTENEAMALANKWDDEVLRNKTINSWVTAAKAKYEKISSGK